jgi:hypothetical protein
MSEVAYLTREEAAMTCDGHVDTIRHDQRREKYPNARPRPDDVIEIPVSDLVAAGRLDPLAANAPHTEIVSKARIERELLELRAQLAVKMVITDSFEGTLARVDEEIKFLRGLLRERWAA